VAVPRDTLFSHTLRFILGEPGAERKLRIRVQGNWPRGVNAQPRISCTRHAAPPPPPSPHPSPPLPPRPPPLFTPPSPPHTPPGPRVRTIANVLEENKTVVAGAIAVLLLGVIMTVCRRRRAYEGAIMSAADSESCRPKSRAMALVHVRHKRCASADRRS